MAAPRCATFYNDRTLPARELTDFSALKPHIILLEIKVFVSEYFLSILKCLTV
jgi:hypothetical protein